MEKVISLNDTITARSTAEQNAAVGIIRVSGPLALSIARQLIRDKNGNELAGISPRRLYLGGAYSGNCLIDEITYVYFPAPNSYCGDDTIEIFCHGNKVLMDMIIDLVIQFGARLALPGEFTKRAFLNGKIDLTQAESVAELISAQARQEVKAASLMLSGKFGKKIYKLREDLIELIGWAEASIDFPEEEDATTVNKNKLLKKLGQVCRSVSDMAKSYSQGKLIREGIRVAIAGKTNAGKSSLMNAIFDEEKSIVTPIHGTTRDVVEGVLVIGGVKTIFSDTAGLRKTKCVVEQEGVRRAQAALSKSDIIIIVIEALSKNIAMEKAIIEKYKKKHLIIAVNKIDLMPCGYLAPWIEGIGSKVYLTSAKNGHGVNDIIKRVEQVIADNADIGQQSGYMVNKRHFICLKNGINELIKAKKSIKSGISEEYFVEHMKEASKCLGEIIGEVTSDDILNKIFSSFCIGK